MSIESQIVDENGNAVDIRRGFFNGRPRGLITYAAPLYEWKQRSLLFVNADGSRDMAIDATFSGTPDGVHNGTDSTLWTAAATVGTWDFASTAQFHSGTKSIEALNMSDGDIATIAKGSDLDFTNYVALTGWIYITRINAANQELSACFMDNGVLVGNTVNVIDYVDAGNLGVWQKFSIPRADLGIADVNIDELLFSFIVNAGSAPRLYLDDIQVEEAGGDKFVAAPAIGTTFQYKRIEFLLIDAIPSTVADGTMSGLAYDQLLGVSALTSGITLQTFSGGDPQVTVSFRQLSDFLGFTFELMSKGSDGANTFIKLAVDLPVWITLNSRDGDRVEIGINDDLSGLLVFNAIAIGRELVPHADDIS